MIRFKFGTSVHEVCNVKYRIQVVNENGNHHYNETVGLFSFRDPHAPTIFNSLKSVEEKMQELQNENPTWFVQRKVVR